MRPTSALVGALLLAGGSHAGEIVDACAAVKPYTTYIYSTVWVPEITSEAGSTSTAVATPVSSMIFSNQTISEVLSESTSLVESSSSSSVAEAASSSTSAVVIVSSTTSSKAEAATSSSTCSESSVASSSSKSSSVVAPTSSTSSSSSVAAATSSTTSSAAPVSTSTIARTYPADVVDKLRDSSISKLEAYLQQNPVSGCSLENASIRREWSDLSVAEREEYISAVQCLQSLPAKSSTSDVPGARSRYDDFVAVHIKQTDYIHNTANFLSWHRYYVFTYEKALREECGYTGYQPYWNWDRYAADPANSPLFNGNASSLSGNSVNGGCVTTGPFKDLSINLGPGSSLKYNPRCLKRDISKTSAAQTTADKTYSLITKQSTIANFQNTMQAFNGVHGGGHFTIGGDPGGDIYTSPGDPAFFLHHAMIDRVWWIWQLQDLSTRLKAVAGTVAGSNKQGSLTDTVNIGINAGDVQIGDLLTTIGGDAGSFCYIYY